jgi:hypothetical protein
VQLLRTLHADWVLWASIAIVVIVVIIAWAKGLSVWQWFLYSALLGPVALIHILFKQPKSAPTE